MDINIQKLEGIVAGVIIAGIIGFTAYLGYVVFFTGEQVNTDPGLSSVNIGIFSGNPKIQRSAQAVADPNQKIQLDSNKSLNFINGVLYKSFSDIPLEVPMSDTRGRPNPFVPYVTP
ncbi:MAG: hypothetical protein RLZZ308_269 [Candidatus Parcubacteria bacterium]|jgi:hypothetical protein